MGGDQFTIVRDIGKGVFGDVYLALDGRTHPPREVAIKSLKADLSSKFQAKAFLRELRIMAGLKHPGTLELIGLVSPTSTTGNRAQIITPFMANGSVNAMLKAERRGTAPAGWNATAKSMLVFGVADAMAYIHSQEVLHRDLKAANILLNDNFEPVIADYGLARLQGCDLTMNVGTPLHMAPELRIGNDEYTQKVDVFAYAVFLHQLFTDSRALDDGGGELRNVFQLLNRVEKGARLKRPDGIPEFYWKMITECWEQDPDMRPTFRQIVEAFQKSDEWIFPGTDLARLREYQERVLNAGKITLDEISDDDDAEPLAASFVQKCSVGRRW